LVLKSGIGFAGSVWLNDVFLGAAYGNSSNNNAAVSFFLGSVVR
jgi:hypothetical protein